MMKVLHIILYSTELGKDSHTRVSALRPSAGGANERSAQLNYLPLYFLPFWSLEGVLLGISDSIDHIYSKNRNR